MLNHLRRPKGARKKIKIVGRGRGSGHGKTSGRGNKGQNSRASGGVRPGFEGGQMPLIRRIPKRGFTFMVPRRFEVISLKRLQEFFPNATEITPELLIEAKITKRKLPVKILGDGDLKKPLTIKAHAFSRSALEKIKKAGGVAHKLDAKKIKFKKRSKVSSV